MRSPPSDLLINLAAAAALTLAAGSLWHAYKVRYGDETEHAASTAQPSGQEDTNSTGVEPEKQVAPPAMLPSAPAVAPLVAVPASDVPGVPAVVTAAPVAPAPETPAPATSVLAIETAKPALPPATARVSLRDPRTIPTAVLAPKAAPPATNPPTEARAKPGEPSAPLVPMLSDRRALTERHTATAPALTNDPVIRPSVSALRDPRQIVGPRTQDTRALDSGPLAPTLRLTPPPAEVQPAAAIATPLAAATCGPHSIETTPQDGGMMRVDITSNCRANQLVQLAYGGAVLVRRLDNAGRLNFVHDCFAGQTDDLLITFVDGSQEKRPIVANDLDKLSKIAVIWNTPINLDLHAFEYSAGFGKSGHVWEQAASTLVSAREISLGGRRGRGYLSTNDDGRGLGDKLEVYTFFHHDEQTSGVIAMGLDYETRGGIPAGMTCGSGVFAEVRYQVVLLGRRGQATRENGVLSAVPCGATIASQVRFDPLLLPSIRVQR